MRGRICNALCLCVLALEGAALRLGHNTMTPCVRARSRSPRLTANSASIDGASSNKNDLIMIGLPILTVGGGVAAVAGALTSPPMLTALSVAAVAFGLTRSERKSEDKAGGVAAGGDSDMACYLVDGVESDGKPFYMCTEKPEQAAWFMGVPVTSMKRQAEFDTTAEQCKQVDSFNGDAEWVCTGELEHVEAAASEDGTACYMVEGVEKAGKPLYICTAKPEEAAWFMGVPVSSMKKDAKFNPKAEACELEENFNGEEEWLCTSAAP